MNQVPCMVDNPHLENAQSLLGMVRTLPLLPDSARRVVDSASDEFVELSDLASSIECDPAIAARVIGIANTAFFNRGDEICSVEDAIIRVLGLDIVRGIALGMASDRMLGPSIAPAFDRLRFWRSCLIHSGLANVIAARSPVLEGLGPVCALNGLFANIGLLASATLIPDVLQQALISNAGVSETMRERVGCDHRDLAAALVMSWELPNPVSETLCGLAAHGGCVPAPSGAPVLQVCQSLSGMLAGSSVDVVMAKPLGRALCGVLQIEGQMQEIEQEHVLVVERAEQIAGSLA